MASQLTATCDNSVIEVIGGVVMLGRVVKSKCSLKCIDSCPPSGKHTQGTTGVTGQNRLNTWSHAPLRLQGSREIILGKNHVFR